MVRLASGWWWAMEHTPCPVSTWFHSCRIKHRMYISSHLLTIFPHALLPFCSFHALHSAQLHGWAGKTCPKLHLCPEETCDEHTEGWAVCTCPQPLFFMTIIFLLSIFLSIPTGYLYKQMQIKQLFSVDCDCLSQTGGNHLGNWCHPSCWRYRWKNRWPRPLHRG